MRTLAATLALALLMQLHWASAHEQDAGRRIAAPPLNEVQSIYLQHCGGCHGIQGESAPREVPSLRGQVNSFLCTQDGRAYLIRLPNVSLAPVSDGMLADLMNFVVFDLGGPRSRPTTFPAFTAAEVAQLRKQPLTGDGLAAYRARIVEELIERCDAPESLRTYSVSKSY